MINTQLKITVNSVRAGIMMAIFLHICKISGIYTTVNNYIRTVYWHELLPFM